MVQSTIAVVGGGAAGLTAAIFAARKQSSVGLPVSVIILEGAKKPGAKILVSGGGRCNVTHKEIHISDYSSRHPNIVRNILRSFDHHQTVRWFSDMGVELKTEETGKLFPTTDKAQTVLSALLNEAQRLGVIFYNAHRVTAIAPSPDGQSFMLRCHNEASFTCKKLVIATGGFALPKSGSDGWGLRWAENIGHSIQPTTPALAPLLFGDTSDRPFAELSGLTLPVRLSLHSDTGKKLYSYTDSLLFTHLGLSGPAPMNLSRHIAQYRFDTPGKPFSVTFGHPGFESAEFTEQWILTHIKKNPRVTPLSLLQKIYPDKLARMIAANYEDRSPHISRETRQRLVTDITAMPVPIKGDRGYSFAETTAGGVSLEEINRKTMESRLIPNLYFCGEILDADGRIGGFNFQWAWATGYLAGNAAAEEISQ